MCNISRDFFWYHIGRLWSGKEGSLEKASPLKTTNSLMKWRGRSHAHSKFRISLIEVKQRFRRKMGLPFKNYSNILLHKLELVFPKNYFLVLFFLSGNVIMAYYDMYFLLYFLLYKCSALLQSSRL